MIAPEEAMVLPVYAGALGDKQKRKTALLTGASSGIGLDLARLMAPDFDLIITVRNQSELEKLAPELEAEHGNHIHVVPADLARPRAANEISRKLKGAAS
jgi:short-subunit dehydrogenase